MFHFIMYICWKMGGAGGRANQGDEQVQSGAGFSTLIGQGQTRLGSHLSKASECWYASNLMP